MPANPALAHRTLAALVEGGVADLADRPRVVTTHTARAVVARVAWHAYQAGRVEAIAELMTASQVAALLGIDRTRVPRLARASGVGWQIEDGGTWLFRPEDVEAIRARSTGKAGRPRRSAP